MDATDNTEAASREEELCFMEAARAAIAIRARELSPVELTSAILARCERENPRLNCFVTLCAEQALEDARTAEQAVMSRPAVELGPLHGVPIAVKDLSETSGVRTTYGTRAFADHVPEKDSLSWGKLKAAGAILIGKTTTPEFGMLTITESPLTGVTNNPWDTSRTSGGSSGGSAAALASGLATLGWGSDGSGSIRVPAAYCGVVGLKCSYGRISNYGQEVYEGLTVDGPLARSVLDAALMLDVTAGPDPRDPLSLPAPTESFQEAARRADVRGRRVAYSLDLGSGPVARETRESFEAALEVFERDLGVQLEEVDLELPDLAAYCRATWGPALAGAMTEPELVESGFRVEDSYPDLAQLVVEGQEAGAVAYWEGVVKQKGRLAEIVGTVFVDHDLLLTPTAPTPAFPHPESGHGYAEIDGVPVPWPMFDSHRLTTAFNDTGNPAVTVPSGFTAEGLPCGLQIVGDHHRDADVLEAAAAYEGATDWGSVHPRA